MWNSCAERDGFRVLGNVHLVTELAPKRPRLGGDILTRGARHVQAVGVDGKCLVVQRVEVNRAPVLYGIALAFFCRAVLLRRNIV